MAERICQHPFPCPPAGSPTCWADGCWLSASNRVVAGSTPAVPIFCFLERSSMVERSALCNGHNLAQRLGRRLLVTNLGR